MSRKIESAKAQNDKFGSKKRKLAQLESQSQLNDSNESAGLVESDKKVIELQIMTRRESLEKELLEIGTRTEKPILKEWFRQTYLPAERNLVSIWQQLGRDLKGGKLTKEEAFRHFEILNEFLPDLFPKYMQVAYKKVAAVLHEEEVNVIESYEDRLPFTYLDNLDNINLFKNFVKDDIIVQAQRHLKYEELYKVACNIIDEELEILPEPRRTFFSKEAIKMATDLIVSNILDGEGTTEEAVYDRILSHLRGLWGEKKETEAYLMNSKELWGDQKAFLQEVLIERLNELPQLRTAKKEAKISNKKGGETSKAKASEQVPKPEADKKKQQALDEEKKSTRQLDLPNKSSSHHQLDKRKLDSDPEDENKEEDEEDEEDPRRKQNSKPSKFAPKSKASKKGQAEAQDLKKASSKSEEELSEDEDEVVPEKKDRKFHKGGLMSQQSLTQYYSQQMEKSIHKFDRLEEKKHLKNRVRQFKETEAEKWEVLEEDGNEDEDDNEQYNQDLEEQAVFKDQGQDSGDEDYVPRHVLQEHIEGSDFAKILRQSKADPSKFTRSTDPARDDKLSFMVDEGMICPNFLPMERADAILSKNVMQAALVNPEIPLCELIRKEFYYDCFTKFRDALSAEPALVIIELKKKLRWFDTMYDLEKTKLELARSEQISQGEYRRICALFYLQTRRLVKDAFFLLSREGKKRVMPRHLLAAAVLGNVIPRSMVSEKVLSKQELHNLDQLVIQRRKNLHYQLEEKRAAMPKNRKQGYQIKEFKLGKSVPLPSKYMK